MQNTSLSPYQKAVRWLAALGMCATVGLGSAQAGNVGISVGIHVPGAPVYVAPPPPPPRVVYYGHPGYYAPPPAVVYHPARPPHWAPAHGKRWKPHRHHHGPHGYYEYRGDRHDKHHR